ncbi:MAG: Gfo/Idh/MocA family oxidoreductase [Verrucomicrobia bacterium]|nr:Gfo/Idh/MocA family oxidoreductase [Verrucomicrobiota bacterium]MBV8378563.1 Gfo/Idh/MocA family oxidoreductase [Verrucomicrobiota bacterium]
MGFAIIGCGLIGNRRAGTLPEGTLKWACDVDPGKASALVTKHGGQATAKTSDVLADGEVDVVLISATNAALAPLTMLAVENGKHVLVEKPGAVNSKQFSEMESAITGSSTLVRIGYNHRFHPAFRKAYELVREADLGDLMFIRGRYGHGGRIDYDREWRADPKLSGGGELIDQGVHLIDLAASFMGEFTTVNGHAATYFWNMPVDDNAFLSLRTAAGQTAWLQVSCTEWKNLFSFEIYFKRAKLHIEGLGGSYGLERLSYYKMVPEMGPPETVIYEFPRNDTSLSLELDEFLGDIRSNRLPSPSLREARQVLEIVERIYENSGYRF